MRDDFTPSPDNPLCGCGCGQPVPIYQRTNKRFGMKRGEFATFVSGHNRKRYFTEEEHREALRRNQETFRRRNGVKPHVRSGRARLSAAEHTRQRSAERRQWLESFKAEKSCTRCGTAPENLTKLEFHHRDPSTKVREVSQMLTQSMEQILAEIEKCDLLCRSCHREVHVEWRRSEKVIS